MEIDDELFGMILGLALIGLWALLLFGYYMFMGVLN